MKQNIMPKLPKAKLRSWIPKPNKQDRQYNNQAFYNSKGWRMTRKIYIKNNPLCEECKKNNLIVSGNVVDHIKQINKGGNLYDQSNLQTLCNSCHAKKSAYESVEYRKGIKDYVRKR